MPLTKRIRSSITIAALVLALAIPGFAHAAKRHKHPHAKHTASHHHKATYHSRHYRRTKHRHHAALGQRVMDSDRATQIQEALIRAHYLDGTPSGQWDAATQAAMVKYQSDNGWQSKIAPDSRALIKLGLGPKQDAGEYSTAPNGVSKLSNSPPDPIRTLATSEMPAASANQTN